jgi:hypothetical protein
MDAKGVNCHRCRSQRQPLEISGPSIPFHGHLFRKTDGSFRFSDKDRRAYPAELLRELESIVKANPQ